MYSWVFFTIPVHESVRKHIEEQGIDSLIFVEPEDYMHQ